MTEVYAVVWDEGVDSWTMGIFSTYEKAHACVEQIEEETGDTHFNISVVSYLLDYPYLADLSIVC